MGRYGWGGMGEAGVGGREAMRKEGGHIWVGGISP